MSFQAYLDNIEAKTGKSPAAFKAMAREKGFCDADGVRPGVKAGEILDWLKHDFDLGRGHGMALVALFKGKRD
ncbi:uncharacterized protein DUF4287 [Stella humosa]|uniref:Uncharacterized protein DUF4287 n=1 Tax=Stella humosa TaxID=94 RepID=A0A3N1KV90_9PROT|nr:DUF4287 domain-containing protein [Stella humosa]ROP81245.1 uncharacterized protein DUF4287 [Stella humosa]BBK32593.1 hypothetical protein STHU_32270 [Stella humosa]